MTSIAKTVNIKCLQRQLVAVFFFLLALLGGIFLTLKPSHAGFFDDLIQGGKKMVGSLAGGIGTDVYEVTMVATPAADSQITKDNLDSLNSIFICDLRKSEKRI